MNRMYEGCKGYSVFLEIEYMNLLSSTLLRLHLRQLIQGFVMYIHKNATSQTRLVKIQIMVRVLQTINEKQKKKLLSLTLC